MLKRLGNVLFWLGIIIAIGWTLFCYWAFTMRAPPSSSFDLRAAIFTVLVISVPSLLIGWALRYILKGN